MFIGYWKEREEAFSIARVIATQMTELLVFSLHSVSYLADGQLEHYFKSSYIPIMNRLMNYLLFGAKVWCFQIEKNWPHFAFQIFITNYQLSEVSIPVNGLLNILFPPKDTLYYFLPVLTHQRSFSKDVTEPSSEWLQSLTFFLLSSCPDPLTVLTSIYDDLTILQLPITSQICDLTTWKFLIHSTFPISVARAIFST